MLAQGVRLLVRFGSAAALARILTPSDYGLYGMAAAVFGLLQMARDLGVVAAVQQPDLTPARFNALCRLGLFGGVALALGGAALARPTGRFFDEPHTVPAVLAALCGTFIFSGCSAPAIGLLYREGKAGAVAMFETMAWAAGSVAAIFAAFAGAGVWALVILSGVNELVLCLLSWRACPWRFGLETAGTRWSSTLAFGALFSGHGIASYCARMLDQVTVGRTAGAAALGLYGRGAQLTALPAQFTVAPFASWILAELSRTRNNVPEFVRVLRRALNSLLHVSFALAVPCIVVPDLLLHLLFGPVWISAAPIVRALGVTLAMQPWLTVPLWVLGSAGNARALFHWSLCGLALMAAGCWVAYRFGPAAVAVAAATTAVAQSALGPAFCRGASAARIRDWLHPAFGPVCSHGGFGICLWIVDGFWGQEQAVWTRLSLVGATILLYYASALAVSARVRHELQQHLFWSR